MNIKEIVYSYPGIGNLEHLEFTNSRKVAVRLVEAGFIPCLTPQMFFLEQGIYGLYLQGDRKTIDEKEAEKILSSCEQSVREANQGILYPSGTTGSESFSQTNSMK